MADGTGHELDLGRLHRAVDAGLEHGDAVEGEGAVVDGAAVLTTAADFSPPIYRSSKNSMKSDLTTTRPDF